jgi:predicted MPP superfamily phosphohydrolase
MLAYLLHVTEQVMPRWVQFAIFFLMVTLIYFGAHFYVYRRMVVALSLQDSDYLAWIRLATLFLILTFPVSRLMVRGIGINIATKAFDWLACAWMGMFFYLFLGALIAHIVSLAFSAAGVWPVVGKVLTPRVSVSLVASAAIALSIYGYIEARWTLTTTRIEVPVKNLPPERDGFTIAQISDIHMGVIVADRSIKKMVEEVNSLKPDLVVITGDLVDEDANHLEHLTGTLKSLSAPNGVLAVTGNHDFYAGVDRVVANAASAGVRFLRNAKTTIAGFLDVYGADDPTSAQFAGGRIAPESLLGPEAMDRPTVFLYHQPIRIEEMAARGADLLLSGHTHKGQIWPISYISRRIYPYQTGLYKIGKSSLYVSRGIGTWGPPLRVDSVPEIVLITLRRR